MKTALKNQWIEALLSGKYKQGHSELRSRIEGETQDLFCCLGVFCDIVAPEQWEKAPRLMSSDCTAIYHGKTHCYPTLEMENEYHLNVTGKVASMNDYGKSFAEIAEWIKENVEEED